MTKNRPMGTMQSATSKQAAGISVFLQEELGDARMRCMQLKKYVGEASKLIEESEQRDQIFEVAGHLLHGIPECLLKLEKALDATALAASRLDYEEIKGNLRPEKVEELERALEDVRLRQVQRRSFVHPTHQRTLLTAETADDLIRQANERDTVKTTVRRVLASTQPTAEQAMWARFEEGESADPTKNMSPEDADKWKEMNEEHGDNFKEASSEDPWKVTAYRNKFPSPMEMKRDFLTTASRMSQVIGEISPMLKEVMWFTSDLKANPGQWPSFPSEYLKHVSDLGPNIKTLGKACEDAYEHLMQFARHTSGAKSASSKSAGGYTPQGFVTHLRSFANTLFDFRGDALRGTQDLIHDLLEDGAGFSGLGLYDNHEARALRDELYEIDHLIGNVASMCESLAYRISRM